MYTAFWYFSTHLLLVVRQISQSIHWIPREQALKNVWAKKYVHIPGCQKSGAFHIGIQKKIESFIYVCWKKGANHIPGSAKKSTTKTRLYNFDPLKPHFCTVKLGFTGVYIIFLIYAQKHRLWVLVRTVLTVLTSTHNLCIEQEYENIRIFHPKSFRFFGGKILTIFE